MAKKKKKAAKKKTAKKKRHKGPTLDNNPERFRGHNP
jgi:spore coat polysaccharide biosynthesis protein SpsF (cytidylyltransferase family)